VIRAAAGSRRSSVSADVAAAPATAAAASSAPLGQTLRSCVPSEGASARPIHHDNPIEAELWARAATKKLLARATRTYARRRAALVEALAAYGISAHGETGLGVWVPLAEEAAVVQSLLERGWAVSPGERYRFASCPGIRITTADLEVREAKELAAALDAIVNSAPATYAG
jgi:DNA-binding transcriptional MocR family regulator